jgi:hypothetical protein
MSVVDRNLDALGWPFWFVTPNSPDLGCFVERKHAFEVDGDWPFWMEFAPWEFVNGVPQYIPHQVYARAVCGDAAYYQRIKAYMAPSGTAPFSLLGLPPDHVLGGDFRPRPGDWVKYPVQSGAKDYWFIGEYRNPATTTWQLDASVGHSFDQYQNGTLSTVGWDDTGGDLDRNDLIMEVAVVYRRRWFDQLVVADIDQIVLERFEREGLPRYRSSDRLPPEDRT